MSKKEKGNRLFHKIDKYLGIPIVFVLGLFHRKKSQPKEINSIAILNIGSIGDNVIMSSSILDLRKAYPRAKISVFTGSTNYGIVKLLPGVDEVTKLLVGNPLMTVSEISNQKEIYDLLIDFGPWPRANSIYSFFFKAKYKIGFNSEKQYRHYIYDLPVIHSRQKHEIDNYRALITSVVSPPFSRPQIIIHQSAKVDKIIANGNIYCIIHPWPGGFKSYMKEWKNDNWTKLIEEISKLFKTIFLTGAPSDVKKSMELHRLIKSKGITNVQNMAGELTISETIYFISKSSFIFTVNTGIAHIAAALDTPQICLHGPTNIDRWGPYSHHCLSLSPSSGTYGYLHFGNEYHLSKENCMDNIGPDMVIDAFFNYKKITNNT
jgi:heptosyltransferase I